MGTWSEKLGLFFHVYGHNSVPSAPKRPWIGRAFSGEVRHGCAPARVRWLRSGGGGIGAGKALVAMARGVVDSFGFD